MRLYRVIILIVFSLLLSETGNCQEISGIITSSFNGEPIVGATVIIKGTNTGTITDSIGKYQIQVDSMTQILSIGFIGYETKDIEILNREVINMTLDSKPRLLEKLIIIENSKDSLEVGDIQRVIKLLDNQKVDTVWYSSNSETITNSLIEDSIKVANIIDLIPKINNDKNDYVVDFLPDRTVIPCFQDYIGKSMQYPREAKKHGVKGVVYLTFTASIDGNFKDIKILREVDSNLENEVLKTIRNLPQWLKTGMCDITKMNGKTIETKYILPILFDLDEM